MTVKKVFVSRKIPEKGLEMLKAAGLSVTVSSKDRPLTQPELIEQTLKHDALLCTGGDKIDAYFLNQCSHLEIISQFAAGYDNINIEKARELKIPVGNAPDAMSEATADVAFALMLNAARKMFFMHKKIERGEWDYFRPNVHLGLELKNKTLGVFGLGKIGMKMAERCKGAYQMEIIYHNRTANQKAEDQLSAKRVDFDTLLKESDVLSVHCALTDQTRGIFDQHAFKKMKPEAIFINTARGAVHNELDLIDALKNKAIWGAGLDVTNPEPMQKNNPLLQMENVAVLPHIGSATVNARSEMAIRAASNIIAHYTKKGKQYLIV